MLLMLTGMETDLRLARKVGKPAIAAYDDVTLDELWKVNVGSGIAAPPMSFEANGKQYVAIATGPSGPAKAKIRNTPELSEQRNATVLYVFGL